MRARIATAALTMCFVVLGCHPSDESVAKNVKASMQSTFDSDPNYKPLQLKVASVTVIRSRDNSYNGLATVSSFASKHDIEVNVTTDGEHLIWKTEAGALSVFAPDLMRSMLKTPPTTESQVPPSMGSPSIRPPEVSSSEDLTRSSIGFIQNRYVIKAEARDVLEGGVWTAREANSQDPNFREVTVSLTSPKLARDCFWQVEIPTAALDARSVESANYCAAEYFEQK